MDTSKVLNVSIDSNGFEKMKIDGLKLANLMLPIKRATSPEQNPNLVLSLVLGRKKTGKNRDIGRLGSLPC